MKKILVTTLVASALVVSAFAQGTVTFSAAKGSLQYTLDGTTLNTVPTTASGGIPGYTGFNVALYAAPKGNTLSLVNGLPDFTANGWMLASPILKTVAPFAGQMANNVVTIPAVLSGATGGNTVQLEVVAWTGSATSFEAAVAAGGNQLFGYSGGGKSGGALTWQQATGTTDPPSTVFVTAGAAGFNGLVLAPVPEPSTFALAGLGAAALLIFRRRK